VRVYIGWDPREEEAFRVAGDSLRRRSSIAVDIQTVRADGVCNAEVRRPVERRDGNLWCPISQAPMATAFACSRFIVPIAERARFCPDEWVLFVDCDVVFLGDVAELLRIADPRFAVMVVKRQQPDTGPTKMDGQTQTSYPRKNWSSVVLWNIAHPGNLRLTARGVDTWPGRHLHAFRWLRNEEIGELPRGWNHLVGIDPPEERARARLLHYTLGGPWLPGWRGGPLDDLWVREAGLATAETSTP
jgi:hypothetical protein